MLIGSSPMIEDSTYSLMPLVGHYYQWLESRQAEKPPPTVKIEDD